MSKKNSNQVTLKLTIYLETKLSLQNRKNLIQQEQKIRESDLPGVQCYGKSSPKVITPTKILEEQKIGRKQ